MGELNDFIKRQIQRILNTQKKLEIGEHYKASFLPGSGESLPPEIEAEWLAQIEALEQQYEHARKIPLLEFIGSPSIARMDDISKKELITEYNRLESILLEKEIYIDFPDTLDIEEKYRFISEELIHEVIDDIHIQGMQLHFIYEEYHPGEDLN
jgi:hypothetical protein